MEKIVIFDWGGVILKEYPNHYCDRDAIVETIRKFNSTYSFEEAYQIYLDTVRDENNRHICSYNDEINKHKWVERIINKGNLNTTYDLFVNEFINNYKKIDKYEDVVNYIYSLKDKIKVYLFSDLIFTCYEALKKQIDLNIFEQVFLSYEEGYIKGDIEAFYNVNNKLQDKEILFIDNNSKNIENAKSVGWNTCLATGDNLDLIKKTIKKFMGD